VQPDTVILEMSNPELQRDVLDAEYALKAAEANYANLRVQVDSDLMSQKANEANVRRRTTSRRTCSTTSDEKLYKEGIASVNTKNLSKVREDQLAIRLQLESERNQDLARLRKIAAVGQPVAGGPGQSNVRIAHEPVAVATRACRNHGVLQLVPIEEGQNVAIGTNVARVG